MKTSLASIAFCSLVLMGCTSAGTDVLDIGPARNDITASIPKPGSPVGTAVAAEVATTTHDTGTAFTPEEESQKVKVEETVQVAALRPDPVRKRVDGKKIYGPRFGDAKPVSFGRTTPKHFPVHGVDVSRWQLDIDWPTLKKQGANFAFIKATEGGDHLDPKFKDNWKQAREAGVPRGAYHFFYWCRVAEEQADWFIRNVPKEKGALPPVVDVEYVHESRSCPRKPSRELVLKKMKVFMDKVEKHYGQKPIIYTAPDFYEDNLQGEFKGHTFWLRSVAAYPKVRYPNRHWTFWQYSGTGLSKGVETHIDLNAFQGSEKEWRKWLEKHSG